MQEQIEQDLATAMKAGETAKVGVLRLIKTSFKNDEIKLGHALTEAEAMTVMHREAKQRRDSIQAYEQGDRPDLAASEQAELQIINSYLPEPAHEAQLQAWIEEAIKTAGDSPQIGAVIAAVMAQAKGTADGGAVAKLVKKRLG